MDLFRWIANDDRRFYVFVGGSCIIITLCVIDIVNIAAVILRGQ